MLASVALAACGGQASSSVPSPCVDGSAALRAALAAAPGDVRVGGRRLSDCFPRRSSQGDVENLGTVFLDTAEGLADESRRRPGGAALLRLGFLIGAAHRGGTRAPGYAELLRRLDSVLQTVPTADPAFARGRAAGASHG